MQKLINKHIIVGITGGIAAYKVADLVSQLNAQGAEVHVVMTESAKQFVSPVTFQALSHHPVRDALWDDQAESGMSHIELARWADLVLIAPASADTLARLTQGRADDLLSTVCLATTAPIILAPAMNQHMWLNSVTQRNVKQLQNLGYDVWGPASGKQACGDEGPGRMLEPAELIKRLEQFFLPSLLANKKVLITAGPTQEALDPVRYITNRSSGKMGYALASAAQRMAAEVTLVSGPVSLALPHGVKRVKVVTAQEMLTTVRQCIENTDLFIATAAVADYRPMSTELQKLKKVSETTTIQLQKNPDILQYVTHLPQPPFTVGFAAETEKLLKHAKEKLLAKKVDMLIANKVAQAGIGFTSDDNQVSILTFDANAPTILPKMSKRLLATQLLGIIANKYHAKQTQCTA